MRKKNVSADDIPFNLLFGRYGDAGHDMCHPLNVILFAFGIRLIMSIDFRFTEVCSSSPLLFPCFVHLYELQKKRKKNCGVGGGFSHLVVHAIILFIFGEMERDKPDEI